MEGVTETLAGRVAILNLLGLSDEEKALPRALPPADYFRELLETGFPRLHGIEDRATRELYLSSYVQTYIERDIRELLRIEKRREFETFVKLCALRTGQIVNYDDLGRDVGVSPATAKSWLSLLEDGFLIRLLSPYFTNRTRRMIKSPRLYFLDAGLAAWLGGWRTAEEARLGPMGGALFETHVLAEVVKGVRHRAREVDIHFLAHPRRAGDRLSGRERRQDVAGRGQARLSSLRPSAATRTHRRAELAGGTGGLARGVGRSRAHRRRLDPVRTWRPRGRPRFSSGRLPNGDRGRGTRVLPGAGTG